MSKPGHLYCLNYFVTNDTSRKSIPQLVVKSGEHLNPTKAFHTSIKKIPLIFYHEGFLAVGIDDEYEGRIIANIFKYLMHTWRYVFHSVKNGTLIYYNSKKNIDFQFYHRNPCEGYLRPITINQLKKNVKIASKIYRNESVKDNVLLLVNAMDVNVSRQASFLFYWLIIEKYLYKKWEDEIKKRTSDNGRINNLISPNAWPINRILELEELFGIIDNNHYKKYQSYKDVRNKLSHGKIPKIDGALITNIKNEVEFLVDMQVRKCG